MRARSELLLYLAVGLAALAVQLPIAAHWLSLLDEGYLLAIADDVNRGQLLYRDVYVDAPFPGAFYLLAGWFRVAGTSILASRVLMVLTYAVFTLVMYGIGRRVLSRGWALGLVVLLLGYRIWAFPHWHVVHYSSLSATFLTLGVVLVLVHVADGSRVGLAVAGALVGAGILCKQDYGVGVGVALGVVLLVRPLVARRLGVPPPGALGPAALFAGGVAAVVVPVLAAFAAAGGIGPLVDQTFARPLSIVTGSTYTGLPSLRPLFHQDAALRADIGSYLPAILLTLRWERIAASALYRETAVWDVALKALFYLPFVVWGLAALAWLARVRRGGDPHAVETRLVLLAWAGGFLLAFNRPRDWVHLMMIYPPALVLGTALVGEAVGAIRPPRVRRLVTVLAAATAAALLAVSLDLALELRRAFTWPLRVPRGAVYTDARHGPIIEDVLRWVAAKAPPGTPVPVYPLQPMLAFLAGRETAGGFHVIWPGQDPARDERIIADLEGRNVRAVVYSLSQYASLGSFRANAPRLNDYLARHYTIDRVFAREPFGPLVCGAVRRDATPPGRPLLEAASRVAPAGTVAPALWPFTPVMAQRIGTAVAPRPARVVLDVPPGGARLAFAYGVNPERWLDAPTGPFTFTVEVEHGARTRSFRATVDPYRVLADRRWIDADVDLAPYAGRRVTLVFTIDAPAEPARSDELAGWADPRVVVR
jgi:dolichyl-phosphate-mannose-protein mannosyltransferase